MGCGHPAQSQVSQLNSGTTAIAQSNILQEIQHKRANWVYSDPELGMFLSGTDEPMKTLPIALTVAVLGTTLVGASAQIQRRGFASARTGRVGGAFGRTGRVGGALGRTGRVGSAFGQGPGARRRTGRQDHVRGNFPRFAYAPYYSGFGYDSDFGLNSAYEPAVEVPPPQVVAEQPAATATPPPPPKPAEGPVLLELHGNDWVRITSEGPPQVVGQSYRPEPEKASNAPSTAASALLVFRDGHQEEIGKYCIIGGTIHISADRWSTGSWTRTVNILDLDVPATLKLNKEQGTRFRLPSGPYEVMIGG